MYPTSCLPSQPSAAWHNMSQSAWQVPPINQSLPVVCIACVPVQGMKQAFASARRRKVSAVSNWLSLGQLTAASTTLAK